MEKKYGVRITMPGDDPLRAEHLLGADWEAKRWFDTAEERDAWLEEQGYEHVYSRRGDIQSQVYEKIERE
ncbi:MAG TPA: hypothetical protein VFX38_04985 [Gammaproteobacteria bacterium]|nr:hypothetical protein [Gammaproteobacteria bacterium]